MKHRIMFISLLLLTLFLALAPNAIASNTWYVDGVHGKNKNDCKSRQHACKTIGQLRRADTDHPSALWKPGD